jgi:hypothetical protein
MHSSTPAVLRVAIASPQVEAAEPNSLRQEKADGHTPILRHAGRCDVRRDRPLRAFAGDLDLYPPCQARLTALDRASQRGPNGCGATLSQEQVVRGRPGAVGVAGQPNATDGAARAPPIDESRRNGVDERQLVRTHCRSVDIEMKQTDERRLHGSMLRRWTGRRKSLERGRSIE